MKLDQGGMKMTMRVITVMKGQITAVTLTMLPLLNWGPAHLQVLLLMILILALLKKKTFPPTTNPDPLGKWLVRLPTTIACAGWLGWEVRCGLQLIQLFHLIDHLMPILTILLQKLMMTKSPTLLRILVEIPNMDLIWQPLQLAHCPQTVSGQKVMHTSPLRPSAPLSLVGNPGAPSKRQRLTSVAMVLTFQFQKMLGLINYRMGVAQVALSWCQTTASSFQNCFI